MSRLLLSTIMFIFALPFISVSFSQDSYSWLEPRTGSEKAEKWIQDQNKITLEKIKEEPKYQEFFDAAVQIYTASDRLIRPTLKGKYIYTFCKDSNYKLGLLKRTTIAEFKKENPQWENILDFQDVARSEGKIFIPKMAHYLPPDFERFMITMQEYGSDSMISKEFDAVQKTFVKDGICIPEMKGLLNIIKWCDKDTILFTTDFGPDSVTDKEKFPVIIKILQRGKSPATIFQADKSDLFMEFDVVANSSEQGTKKAAVHLLVREHKTLAEHKYTLVNLETSQHNVLSVPSDWEFRGDFKGRLLFLTRKNWERKDKIHTPKEQALQHIENGSLVAVKIDDLMQRIISDKVSIIWSPTFRHGSAEFHQNMIKETSVTKDSVFINVLDNVKGQIIQLDLLKTGSWQQRNVKLPGNGDFMLLGIKNASEDLSFGENAYNDAIFVTYESFLVPTSLYFISSLTSVVEKVKSEPDRFDATKLEMSQNEATSQDGTKIPYFVVRPKNAEKPLPTILYGYGGFGEVEAPYYLSVLGKLWLEQGFAYAQANIRGGGEFGPKWHDVAIKENRQRCFDDFAAVAQDLIMKKITLPEYLGIKGVSNGGLLVGATFVQKPGLFNAVWCEVGLLDAIRYTQYPGGTGQISEYGDPADPKIHKAISSYSPFDNLKQNQKYPKVFFETRTDDANVYPFHSRKMACKMMEMGNGVFFLEVPTGGHSGSPDAMDRAEYNAIQFTFFTMQLK